jgi:hypothetical protein
VSPTEKIAKLEGLLARVKERAEAPRPNAGAAFAVQLAQAAQPAQPASAVQPELVASAPIVEAAPPGAAPAALLSAPPPDLASGWSEPPPPTTANPEKAATAHDDLDDVDMDDVEVSAELVEVDIDIEEPPPPTPAAMARESGAHPVAGHLPIIEPEIEPETLNRPGTRPEPPEDAQVELLAADPEVVDVDVEEPTPLAAHEPPQPPAANEVVEPAPSSSPRPISTSPSQGYEEESAPRHTPPPESGKQVAAPSVKPEPARMPSEPARLSSAPPPSLDGNTLVGGWREPGIALPREGAGPAVRVPPPPPQAPAEMAPSPVAATAVAASRAAEPVRLGPEVTKADLPGDANVATFEGTLPEFSPATFGELLDATLSL